jgi:hypothetical protein
VADGGEDATTIPDVRSDSMEVACRRKVVERGMPELQRQSEVTMVERVVWTSLKNWVVDLPCACKK